MTLFGASNNRPVRLLWPGNTRYFLYGKLQTGGGSIAPLLGIWACLLMSQSAVYFVLSNSVVSRSLQVEDAYQGDTGMRYKQFGAKFLSTICSTSYVPFILVAALIVSVAHCDPGVLPRPLASKQFEQDINARMTEVVDRNGEMRKVCSTCDIVRPVGGGHCSVCDHCVHGMDHHCHILNVCIAGRNRRSFVMLLYASLFYAILMFLAGIMAVLLEWEDIIDSWTALYQHQLSATVFQVFAIGTFLSTLLVCVPLCRVLLRVSYQFRYVPLIATLTMEMALVTKLVPNPSITVLPLLVVFGSLTALVTLGPFAAFNMYLVSNDMTWKQKAKTSQQHAAFANSLRNGTKPEFLLQRDGSENDNSSSALTRHKQVTREFDMESKQLLGVQVPNKPRLRTGAAIRNIINFATQPVAKPSFDPNQTVSDYQTTLSLYDPTVYEVTHPIDKF